MKRLVTYFFFFISNIVFTANYQRLFLDITNPHIRKLPMAIMKFKNLSPEIDTSLINEVRSTLEFDLEVSGIFKLVPQKAFLKNDVNINKFVSEDWSILGVSGVITTHYKITGGTVLFEFRLFDVATGKLVVGKRYTGTKDQKRTLAHKFSNELMNYYTGEPGIFNTKVAFVSDKTGNKELYIMDYDGKNIEQITHNKSINLAPDWSPDNSKLVYTSYRFGNPDLWLFEFKTRTHKKITTQKGLNTGAKWHPDGKRIIYASSKDGNTDLYILNLDTMKKTRLTYQKGIDISPVIASNGKRLAFVSGRSGQPHLFTMNLNGFRIFRITYAGRYNANPSWFPKGDKLAFAGWNSGKFDIFIVNSDATNMERLTNYSKSNEEPSVSPDGRLIVFQSTRRTKDPKRRKTDLYLINSNGLGERPLLIDYGESSSPSWSNRE